MVGGSVCSPKNWSRNPMIDSSKILSVAEFAPTGWQVSHFTAAEHGRSDLLEQPRQELGSSFVAKMMICFTDFSLWFSLPLSIWLTTGLVGLIFHWQAISKTVCQMENASPDAKPGAAIRRLRVDTTCAAETRSSSMARCPSGVSIPLRNIGMR